MEQNNEPKDELDTEAEAVVQDFVKAMEDVTPVEDFPSLPLLYAKPDDGVIVKIGECTVMSDGSLKVDIQAQGDNDRIGVWKSFAFLGMPLVIEPQLRNVQVVENPTNN